MKALKELSSISGYRPSNGDLLHLYRVANDIDPILNINGSLSYYQNLKVRLRRELLDGLFDGDYDHYTEVQKEFFDCWKRHAQVMILLLGSKTKSGIPEAKKLLRKAERLGIVEICVSLSNQLRGHYGNVGSNEQMYLRYREKVGIYTKAHTESLKMEGWFFDTLGSIKFGHELDLSESQLLAPSSNHFWRYNFYRFLTIHIYHLIKGDKDKAFQTCQAAIDYFGSKEGVQPYTCQWHFHIQSIQILLGRREYKTAGTKISKALSLVKLKGCYNWHVSLLYKALCGFHTGKYQIPMNAFKIVLNTPPKHDNREVFQYWQVVRSWLAALDKIGLANTGDDKFRLYQFLNSVPILEKDKKVNNVSLILVKLLHLLIDKRHSDYEAEASKINTYLYRNLKGQDNLRGRFMLRTMECVPKGRFYKSATEKRAEKWLKKMAAVPPKITPNALQGEMLPFDKVWEIVLSRLK